MALKAVARPPRDTLARFAYRRSLIHIKVRIAAPT